MTCLWCLKTDRKRYLTSVEEKRIQNQQSKKQEIQNQDQKVLEEGVDKPLAEELDEGGCEGNGKGGDGIGGIPGDNTGAGSTPDIINKSPGNIIMNNQYSIQCSVLSINQKPGEFDNYDSKRKIDSKLSMRKYRTNFSRKDRLSNSPVKQNTGGSKLSIRRINSMKKIVGGSPVRKGKMGGLNFLEDQDVYGSDRTRPCFSQKNIKNDKKK